MGSQSEYAFKIHVFIIYITCRNTDVITVIHLLVMATWYNSVSLVCLWLQMPDFHIMYTYIYIHIRNIYIYISGFNCLKRASTTHQQQTTHLGTNEEQVSLCQSKDRFRWKINKPAGPGETWGMMRHHNTTKNENHQPEVHRTHQMQRPRPNRDKMEEVWRGRFEEGDSSLQCRQSSLDKLGMVENGEPKKRMFTRDQGRQVSKRTESLNMPSFSDVH